MHLYFHSCLIIFIKLLFTIKLKHYIYIENNISFFVNYLVKSDFISNQSVTQPY
jgi:hypothetical protein